MRTLKHAGGLAVAVFMLAPSFAMAQTPLGSQFTYQGELKLLGQAVNDTADFEFTLWDTVSGPGRRIGAVGVTNVTIIDELFTVELDFGLRVFEGDVRWLEIAVRSPAGGGAYTTLDPRQPLNAVPYDLLASQLRLPKSAHAASSMTHLRFRRSVTMINAVQARIVPGISTGSCASGSDVCFGRG